MSLREKASCRGARPRAAITERARRSRKIAAVRERSKQEKAAICAFLIVSLEQAQRKKQASFWYLSELRVLAPAISYIALSIWRNDRCLSGRDLLTRVVPTNHFAIMERHNTVK